MAYIYLVLSSVCSLFVAHLLKLTEVRQLRIPNMLAVNYLVACFVAFATGFVDAGSEAVWQPEYELLLFCLIVGALFICNFIAYGKSVHVNGMGISISAMRLSLLVPVLVSVYFYGEYIGWTKISGIILVFGAFGLLIPREESIKIGGINAAWLLLIIFLFTGFADASLKVYNEEFSLSLNELMFMGWVYLGAFSIGLILSILRKGPLLTKEEARMGALLGIPNLYSTVFFIYALGGISGAVAFPVVNAINVFGGTLLGLLYWGDKVSTKQWNGIVIAIIAILLLV